VESPDRKVRLCVGRMRKTVTAITPGINPVMAARLAWGVNGPLKDKEPRPTERSSLDISFGIARKSLGMSSAVFCTPTTRDQLTNTIATNEPDQQRY
jgi:hypothetical protein